MHVLDQGWVDPWIPFQKADDGVGSQVVRSDQSELSAQLAHRSATSVDDENVGHLLNLPVKGGGEEGHAPEHPGAKSIGDVTGIGGCVETSR